MGWVCVYVLRLRRLAVRYAFDVNHSNEIMVRPRTEKSKARLERRFYGKGAGGHAGTIALAFAAGLVGGLASRYFEPEQP